MGRGSSGAGRNSETIVQSQYGKPITLDVPLVYGSSSQGISEAQRRALEDFEEKRSASRYEYGAFIDENGNVLVEKRGGKGSVAMPYYAYQNAKYMTHTHPRDAVEEAGLIGGTFSTADISNWANFANIVGKRAAAGEGTYSIVKGKNFNPDIAAAYKAEDNRLTQIQFRERAEIIKRFGDREITYSEAVAQNARSFNRMLVGMHNFLRSKQKEYGYSYQLERRKK